jgi:hypothetical protein
MYALKRLALAASVAGMLLAAAANADEVSDDGLDDEPACPYGYYDFAPYDCAPYGYYGSEWFDGGIFIGTGPWFHGPRHFRGHVDNHFDVHHGYAGSTPNHGDSPEPSKSVDHIDHFRGNEMRDGVGHVSGGGHVGGLGHAGGGGHAGGFGGHAGGGGGHR